MSKKNTIIILIVVAIIVLALGLFLLFFSAPKTTTTRPLSPSPFGNYTGSSTASTQTETEATTTQDNAPIQYTNTAVSPLIRISTAPIAGAEVFDRKVTSTSSASIVRYIERATGHTKEYSRLTNILSNVSNTTIPTIYKATWSGNTVLAQFLTQDKDAIKTFSGNLPSATTSVVQLTGSILPQTIYALAISPKGNRMFSLIKGEDAVGSISNLDGNKKTTILNFPFNEWTAEWPNENTLTLTTKPSYLANGFMYFLSTSGTMTKALGNIAGLTTKTNPSLSYAIYSGATNSTIATGIYDFNKYTSLAFNANPTFPEKCVWSKLVKTTAYCAVPTSIPNGNYPDDWYQGKVSFVDNIYKVNVKEETVQPIYKLPSNQAIDAIELFLDAKEENLYFTNKSDYYLWGLTIKGLYPLSL